MEEELNLEELTTEELTDLRLVLQEEVGEVREIQADVAQIINQRLTQEAAERKLATMSDPEKRALLQTLKAKGIESEEAVGTPGA